MKYFKLLKVKQKIIFITLFYYFLYHEAFIVFSFYSIHCNFKQLQKKSEQCFSSASNE